MQRTRSLVAGSYVVGFALLLVPLTDAVLSVWPAQMGDFRWRYGAAGIMANALLVPVAGLLVLQWVAVIAEHRVMRRMLGAASLAGALLCLATMALFVLDALQTRPNVRPEMNASFISASVGALAKLLLHTAALACFAVAGFRGGAKSSTPARPILAFPKDER